MLYELLQQNLVIATAQRPAQGTGATADVAQLKEQVMLLEKRVERLVLLCQTLWSFLQEDRLLTEQDLLEKMKEIEAQNGKVDGKTVQARPCERCGRPLNPKHDKCLYCGAERTSGSLFEQV